VSGTLLEAAVRLYVDVHRNPELRVVGDLEGVRLQLQDLAGELGQLVVVRHGPSFLCDRSSAMAGTPPVHLVDPSPLTRRGPSH
jgi:hypothetical protein